MDVDISISLELLILLEWLVKNEKPLLDNIVKQSLKNGLLPKLNQTANLSNVDLVEQFYPTIIDFLATLENSLVENINKTNQQTTQDILPVLKKINLSDINLQTIFLSSNQATKRVKNQKTGAAGSQKILFQQILKNWKPGKKDRLN